MWDQLDKNNKGRNLKKNKQTRLQPLERKDKNENDSDVSPVWKQGVFKADETKIKTKISYKQIKYKA